jgi:hypothetical protein
MLLCGTSLPKETEKCPPVCSVLSPACRDQTFGRGLLSVCGAPAIARPQMLARAFSRYRDLPADDGHSESAPRLTVPRCSETSEASG